MNRIKKLAVALTLVCIAALVPALTASPAQADTSCQPEIRADRGSTSHPGDGQYQWEQSLWYQKCLSGTGGNDIIARNRVNGYRICMTRIEGNDFLYDHWRVNPNQIGNWDPATRNFPNDGPVRVCETWGAGGDVETWVRKSDHVVFRCIAAHLTQTRPLGVDFQDDTPEICMSFL